MNRLAAVGAYAPRYRLPAEAVADAWDRNRAKGVESVAVPGADEDALTMAVAAARRALSAGPLAGSAIEHLAFATTTPPDLEDDLTARLGAMLGVPADAERVAFTQSPRAGTQALVTGFDSARPALVVAADCPRGEPASDLGHAAGAGAAAFVLHDEGPASLADRASHAEPYPGTRFSTPGTDRVEHLGVADYERAAYVDVLGEAVDGLESVAGVDAAAIQAPDGGLPYRAAGSLGVSATDIAEHATVDELGDTGAASVPLSLALALADGAGTVLAVGWGGGASADALLVESRVEVPAEFALAGDGPGETESIDYPTALRLRGEIAGGEPAGGGAYVSVPAWRRAWRQRYRLEAGRCPDCGALAFPPEGACPDCDALVAYDPVELPGTGTVEADARISQGGAPPEFAPQQSRGGDFDVAVVAFDGPPGEAAARGTAPGADGQGVSVPTQVADGHELAVGDRVGATLRRIYTQEGVTRYGFKVVPTAEG